MERPPSLWILLLILAGVVASLWRVDMLTRTLDRNESPNVVEATVYGVLMDELELQYRSARELEIIRTKQKTGETTDAFNARHDARVAERQAAWPPV